MQDSLWTKNFTMLLLSSLLVAISFYFLLPILPVIAVKQLGVDNSQAGYLIGVYTLSSLLIRPFAGYAIDSFGRKRIFLFSICFFALFSFSYYLAATFIFFVLIRLLHGFTWGIFNTGSATITADIVPSRSLSDFVRHAPKKLFNRYFILISIYTDDYIELLLYFN